MTIYLAGYDDRPDYPGTFYNIGREEKMPPKKPYYPRIACLAPSWLMEDNFELGFYNEQEYKEEYSKLMIERQREVRALLKSLQVDEDQVWCCFHSEFESPEKKKWGYRRFCHRYLVAKVLKRYRPDIAVEIH